MRRRIWLVVVVFVIGAVGRSEGADAPTDAVEKGPRCCATLRELVDTAGDTFRPVRGAVLHDSLHVWAATLSIPVGTDCRVFGSPLPIYGCTLYFDDDGRAADTVYHAAAGEVAACLGSEWTSREFTTGETAHTTVSRPGGGPVVRVTSGISDAVGYEVRFWIDGH